MLRMATSISIAAASTLPPPPLPHPWGSFLPTVPRRVDGTQSGFVPGLLPRLLVCVRLTRLLAAKKRRKELDTVKPHPPLKLTQSSQG